MPKLEMLRGILSATRSLVTDLIWSPRRCIAASAVAILLAIFLGCMSINIGWPSAETGGEDVLVQKGTLHPSEFDQDVFYPIPYTSPPNLTIDEPFHRDVLVVEQEADHFRVRYTKDKPLAIFGVEWTARGTRAPAIKPPTQETAAPQ